MKDSVFNLAWVVATLFVVVVASPMCSAQAANVTTWRNDNGRTGQNISENTLTSSNVTEARFGKICSAPVDGQVYAQPLVVWDSVNSRNIVYVATMNDSIYAFNGRTCSVIASNTSLIPRSTEAPADCHLIGGMGCQTIKPTVGILGTPVIDLSTNTIYLVTESQSPPTSPTNWYHKIHALNATTLLERSDSPKVIAGQVNVGGVLTFDSYGHIQRPGLLYLATNGQSWSDVYIAFSLMDGSPKPLPSGWIFAYKASDLGASGYPHIFATAPQQTPPVAFGGGLWMGAAGIAADATGNIYVTSADGTFDLNASGSNAADSFLKLTNDTLTISSYFTPSDQLWRACFDADLGSGGPTMLPLGPWGNYLSVNADKEGALWVNDTTNLGGFHAGSCDQTQCPQTHTCFPGSQDNHVLQAVWTNPSNYYHTSLAYWNSNLYVAGSNLGSSSSLVQYPMCGTGPGAACSCTTGGGQAQVICPGPYNSSSTATFPWGASPSVSSTSTMTNGIVWAIESSGYYIDGPNAVLHAFNALGSGGSLTELYNSNQCYTNHVQVDHAGPSIKFSVPTVANGYVYIGTQGDPDTQGPLYVYGEIAPINPRVCSGS